MNFLLQVVQDVTADAPASAAASSFMHFPAWLASHFAQEIKHSRRATGSTQHSQHHPTHQGPSVPLSADFHFAALLLQPLLNLMQANDTITDTTGRASDAERQQPQSDAAQHTVGGQHSSKAQKRGKRGSHKSQKTSTVPLQWSTAAHGAALLVGSCLLSSATFAMPFEQL